MKNLVAEAERWFAQARYDFKEACACLRRNSFSYACFFSEQAAQKFLKGYLILQGERFLPIHSVGGLLEKAAHYDADFRQLTDEGRRLDRYYLITRYPDALPSPALPYESYTRDEAEEAIAIAKKIGEVVGRLE